MILNRKITTSTALIVTSSLLENVPLFAEKEMKLFTQGPGLKIESFGGRENETKQNGIKDKTKSP